MHSLALVQVVQFSQFYCGVLTLGLGQAGGARLGAQLYFAPEVDAKLVPSLVLNYGM